MKNKSTIIKIIIILLFTILGIVFLKLFIQKQISKAVNTNKEPYIINKNLYSVNKFNIIHFITNKKTFNSLKVIDYFVIKKEEIKEPYFVVDIPKEPNGKAIILCPPGGYHIECIPSFEDLKFFLNLGYTIFTLYYKQPSPENPDAPINSLYSMIKIVRKYSKIWGVDPNKIGAFGISAGGHLIASASNYFDENTKLNFAILHSSVISMQKGISDAPSCFNLTNNNPKLIEKYSMEKNVVKGAPKTFMIAMEDDPTTYYASSKYVEAMQKAGNDIEYAFYQYGGHSYPIFGSSETALDCQKKLKTFLQKI